MSWWLKQLPVLDLETTGTDPATCRIVQAALVVLGPDDTVDGWHRIVNPGVEIPPEAATVHGITTQRARAEGVPAPDAVRELVDRINRLSREEPLVIYNAPFDWRVLLEEAKRHGCGIERTPPIIDPLLLDRTFDKYRPGSRRLIDVARHYGVARSGDAHDARVDAILAGRIARALPVLYPDLQRYTPAELHELQVEFYRAWRDDFNAYQAGPRGKGYRVDGEWPA